MKSKKKVKPIWKFTILFLIIAAVITGAVFGINGHVKTSTKNRMITVDEAIKEGADCILVLGAGVRDDGSPSNMLEDRLKQGIELYELGAAPKLLLSGDHGQVEYDEVNCMKQFALDAGVPSEDIFLDHAGFSTYESLYRARDIFLSEKVIIVTQQYHMYRALYIARALGLDAYGVVSNPRNYAQQGYQNIRETLARVKDFFLVIIKPLPTYLGDTIPIFGDGNQTNG